MQNCKIDSNIWFSGHNTLHKFTKISFPKYIRRSPTCALYKKNESINVYTFNFWYEYFNSQVTDMFIWISFNIIPFRLVYKVRKFSRGERITFTSRCIIAYALITKYLTSVFEVVPVVQFHDSWRYNRCKVDVTLIKYLNRLYRWNVCQIPSFYLIRWMTFSFGCYGCCELSVRRLMIIYLQSNYS